MWFRKVKKRMAETPIGRVTRSTSIDKGQMDRRQPKEQAKAQRPEWAESLFQEIKNLDLKVEQKFDNLESQNKSLQTKVGSLEKEVKDGYLALSREVQSLKADTGNIKKQLEDHVQHAEEKIERLEQSMKKVDETMEDQNRRHLNYEYEIEKQKDNLALMEMRLRGDQLRLRGIKEQYQEELLPFMVKEISDFLEMDPEDVEDNIQKVMRVNSGFARRMKVPRDILIQFEGRRLRDRLLTEHQQRGWTIQDKQVIVLRDLPVRVLQKRRLYKFLTDVLRSHNIPYSWDGLEGVFLRYQGERHKLNSVEKARDFLSKYNLTQKRKEEAPTPRPKEEKKKIEDKMESRGGGGGGDIDGRSEELEEEEEGQIPKHDDDEEDNEEDGKLSEATGGAN